MELVGEHAPYCTPEDPRWGAIVTWSPSRVGVYGLAKEILELIFVMSNVCYYVVPCEIFAREAS